MTGHQPRVRAGMIRYLITIALFTHGLGHLLFLANSWGSGRPAMKAALGCFRECSARVEQSRGSSV